MGDMLSKEEIEALLSAVSEGKVPLAKGGKEKSSYKKTAISYNFKRPLLVSKEQIRVLELIHSDFTRDYAVKLSNYLRTTVEIEIADIEQLTYTEFIASLSEPTYLAVLDADPLPTQILIEVNLFLVFSMVDRLLGGSGKTSQEPRELTGIEHSIMDKVITLAIQVLQETWKHVIPVKFTLDTKESNPQFVQIIPGGELVVLIIFEVNMGEVSGIMNICFPYTALEPILPKLSPQQWILGNTRRSEKESLKLLQKNLSETQVEVAVELGIAEITILDFLKLAPGDVVRLNQPVHQDLIVKVEGFPKFYALPGRMGKRRAIQITSIFNKQEDNYGE